jgi:hypothetical protein
MRYHCGAAHSCSSFADPTKKNIQRFKAIFSLNRWIFLGPDRQYSSSYGPRRNDNA